MDKNGLSRSDRFQTHEIQFVLYFSNHLQNRNLHITSGHRVIGTPKDMSSRDTKHTTSKTNNHDTGFE